MTTESLAVRNERARLRIGQVLNDKWRLDDILGTGGMATVYAATHRNGKRAAIKLLHPELTANQDLVARFLREGRVANKLEHPGAVSIIDDDKLDDGSVYLVMELLEGYSLDRHTRRNAVRLSIEEVLRIGVEVLDVLAAAHEHGVIHRDIKPANIFLEKDGHAKILDFGIARLVEPLGDAALTQTGTAIGTPAFMPPEQARGRWNLIDPRTDLWALGATLYALLTGERPRKAETMQEELLAAMTLPLARLAERAPHVPTNVTDIVDCAVAFEREDRFADARAMQAAIRAALAEGVAEVAPGERRSASKMNGYDAEGIDQTTGRPLTSTFGGTMSTRVRSPRMVILAGAILAAAVAVVGTRHYLTSGSAKAAASVQTTADPPVVTTQAPSTAVSTAAVATAIAPSPPPPAAVANATNKPDAGGPAVATGTHVAPHGAAAWHPPGGTPRARGGTNPGTASTSSPAATADPPKPPGDAFGERF